MSGENGDSTHIVGSMNAVGKFFGVSNTTVARDWVRLGMPGEKGVNGKPGRYDLREIVQWREAYLTSLSDPENPEQQELRERLESAQVRKAEAQATIEEIKVEELEGRLIDKETAIAEIEGMFNVVRARLAQIAGECVATIPPEIRADVEEMISYKIRLACKSLAELENP